MARPYTERIEALAYQYEEIASRGDDYLSILREARNVAETIRALWEISGLGARIDAEEARKLISRGEYKEGYYRLLDLCKNMLSDYLEQAGFPRLEVDVCPEPRLVKLFEELRKASKPVKQVFSSLIQPLRNKTSELFENTLYVAREWHSLANAFSKIYTAGFLLEKHGYLYASSLLLSEARKIAGSTNIRQKHEIIVGDGDRLYRAARGVERAVKLQESLRKNLAASSGLLASILEALLHRIEEKKKLVSKASLLAEEVGDPEVVLKVLEELASLSSEIEKALKKTATIVSSNKPENIDEAVKAVINLGEKDSQKTSLVLLAILSKGDFNRVVEEASHHSGRSPREVAAELAEMCLEKQLFKCIIQVS